MTYTPLSEAELDRLEDLLDSEFFGEERLLLDEVQAMLCAAISGPDPLREEEWLPVILGDDLDSNDLVKEARALLVRFHDYIAQALAAGEDIALILYPVEEDGEELDFAAWADAYMLGTEIREDDWFTLAGDHQEGLFELLHPALLLSGSLTEESPDSNNGQWLTPAEVEQARPQAEDDITTLPLRLYNFWRIKREAVVPRRTGPKVGRNDPCPCGSGKKYKQCCGAA